MADKAVIEVWSSGKSYGARIKGGDTCCTSESRDSAIRLASCDIVVEGKKMGTEALRHPAWAEDYYEVCEIPAPSTRRRDWIH